VTGRRIGGSLTLTLAVVLVVAACSGAGGDTTTPPAAATTVASPSGDACSLVSSDLVKCSLDAYPDRPYLAYLPPGHDPAEPGAAIVALHGGSGDALAALRVTCPGGNLTADGCLHRLGDTAGFITIAPNGAARRLTPNVRTWNAGGGAAQWHCVSGFACREDSDDVAYVDAVLDDVAQWTVIDDRRVYAVGLSNGGAMAHRLACERAGRFAAIATVGSANQFSTTADCLPVRSLSVMHIHGTADPCWTYVTTETACLDSGGAKLGADESVAGWVTRNGCTLEPTTQRLPDTADDGTVTDRSTWKGCEDDTEVQLLRIVGGGHTWPGGFAYRPEESVGRVASDFGNEVIWGFLSAWRR